MVVLKYEDNGDDDNVPQYTYFAIKRFEFDRTEYVIVHEK